MKKMDLILLSFITILFIQIKGFHYD